MMVLEIIKWKWYLVNVQLIINLIAVDVKKKQYHVHYIVKKHVEGDGIIMLYEYPRIIQRRWIRVTI